jgi:hypothetical protein
MLQGTAPVAELLGHAATLAAFDTAAETFPVATVFQAMFEIATAGRQASLPAALHPTNPPTMVVQAWACPESPWGAFSVAQVRVGCRHGLRPRGLVQACVVDTEAAAAALRDRWGFPARVGRVHLDVAYHDVSLRVALDASGPALAVHAVDPLPLGPDDVSFATTVVLAHTPRGERLVQVDTDLAVTRAERVVLAPLHDAGPVLAALGVHPSVVPAHPVAASVSRGALTLQALRFVSRPEELAFTGAETV